MKKIHTDGDLGFTQSWAGGSLGIEAPQGGPGPSLHFPISSKGRGHCPPWLWQRRWAGKGVSAPKHPLLPAPTPALASSPSHLYREGHCVCEGCAAPGLKRGVFRLPQTRVSTTFSCRTWASDPSSQYQVLHLLYGEICGTPRPPRLLYGIKPYKCLGRACH